MCYTRELVCVECNLTFKRYKPKECCKGRCSTDQTKVYLKYNLCPSCKTVSDLKPTLTATTDEFKVSVVFNRKPKTSKGLAGSNTRRRRHKHQLMLTDEEVRLLVLLNVTMLSQRNDAINTCLISHVTANMQHRVNVTFSHITTN